MYAPLRAFETRGIPHGECPRMQGHTRRLPSTASLPSPVPTSCSSRAPGKGSFVSRCCLLTPGQTPTPSLLPQISLQNTLPKSRVLGGAEFRCPAEWHPCLSSAARHRCWRSGPWDLRICRLPLDRLPPPPPPPCGESPRLCRSCFGFLRIRKKHFAL